VTPTAEEIGEIAYFLGVMHCRVRRHVARVSEALTEIGQWLLKRHGDSAEAMQALYVRIARDHPDVRVPSIEETRAALARPEQQFLMTDNEKIALGLGLMDTPKTIGNALRPMHWCLCTAPPGAAFITGDAPLNIFLQRGETGTFDTGLAETDVDVVFPISPQICLRIRHDGSALRVAVTDEELDAINRRIALAAERFAIASFNSAAVEQLVREFAVTRNWPKWKPGTWRDRLDRLFDDE
jgi:hypothetical protein